MAHRVPSDSGNSATDQHISESDRSVDWDFSPLDNSDEDPDYNPGGEPTPHTSSSDSDQGPRKKKGVRVSAPKVHQVCL